MKSWILLFSLINAATIFAQTSNHEKVVPSRGFISKIEIFGGVTWMYPKTYFEPEESERQFKLGNVIGGALTHSFSNRFEIKGSVCATQKRYVNTEFNEQNPSNNLTLDLKNNYLVVSFLPRVLFGHRNHFSIGAGGYAAHLQKSKTTSIYVDLNSVISTSTSDTEDKYKKYDAGLTISVGFEVPIKQKYGINLQVVSNNGLTKVNTSAIPSVISIERNNTIELLFGIILRR